MSFLTGESLNNGNSLMTGSPPSRKHDDISICNSSSAQPAPSNMSVRGQQSAENKTTKTKREVYNYETDWLVSSVAWSSELDESFELAVGSFAEEYGNRIHLVSLSKDSYDEEIKLDTSFNHPYPPTKISWIPRVSGSTAQLPHLLATSADCLRIWRIPTRESNSDTKLNENLDNNETECDSTSKLGKDVRLECSLRPNKATKFHAPLTSFDWNEIDPRIMVTSSVDTTCAVWDLEIEAQINSISHTDVSPQESSQNKISYRLQNQILAHDHEVYDVSFSRQGSGRDIFITAGGDGSLRLFDLRMLSTSTVLYETDDSISTNNRIGPALVRVACNKQDANYVSTFSTDSKDLILIDVRKTGKPIAILRSHSDNLNGMSWAPHSAHHLCSASEDSQALIWGLLNMQDPAANEPLLAYKAAGKINTISWSSSHPDWIAIGFENCLELLRV